MTSIEQIQISGVRSFDPNPARRQTIIFHKPLTVILGKNGAGKTTIIEALLNACTGQMPPGSGTEKSSFVYDPKVMGETDVKAQIRLLFTGRGGKLIQVIRSFRAVRARNRTTFSTLDNTVAFQDAATGKILSSTYRATDVDRAVPEMLGVSSAVLEHVIFCHQEDGNWPLSPPKDVKRIFDEIFAATRYVLALDRLRENSKELRRQQKEHEANLMTLREHREQAQELRSDIAAKEELAKTIQERARAMEPQLKKLHAVAAALSAAEHKAESLAREAAMIQGRIEEKQESLNKLSLPVTNQKLEEIIEHKQSLAERASNMEKVILNKTMHLQVAETNNKQHEETALELRTSIGFFEEQELQQKQNFAEFQTIVKGILQDFVFAEDDINDKSVFQKVDQLVNAELQKATEERDNALRCIDDKIKNFEEQRAVILRLVDADCKEKEMKVDQQRRLEERIVAAEKTLETLRPDTKLNHIQALQRQVTELEQRVEAINQLKRSGEQYKERQHILEQIDKQNHVVAELRQELMKYKEHSDWEAEINLLQIQIAEKQRFVDTALQERLIPTLSLLGHDVSENQSLTQVSLLVEKLRDQKTEVLRLIQEERNGLDRQVAVLQQRQTQRMDEIKRESLELQEKQIICVKVLGSVEKLNNFEGHFQGLRSSLQRARDQKHALEAMSACHANFVEVAKAEGKCAVCNREFNDDEEVANFVKFNDTQKKALPNEVEKAQLEVVNAERMLSQFEGIESDVHNLRRLASNIPKLQRELASIDEELANKFVLLKDVEYKQKDVEGQLMRVQELFQHVKDVNVCASDIRTFKQELERREDAIKRTQLKISVTDASNKGKTYEQLSLEYEEANRKLYNLNLMLNEAQRREEGESDQAAANELNVKRAECYQLEMKLMRQKEFEDVIVQCKTEADDHKKRIAAINTRRTELEDELRKINTGVEALRKDREKLSHGVQFARITQIEESIRMLARIVPKILEYIASNNSDRLVTMREKLRSAEALSLASAEEVKQLQAQISEARCVVDESFRRTLEIDKQIEALEKRQLIEEDQARLRDIEKTLSELKKRELSGVTAILGEDVILCESVSRIREIIRSKVSELERSRAQQEGNVEAMMQDIASLKGQLGREKYQEIEKRYRSTFLRVQTTEIAVADVEKYYRALEKAVQSYHQEKIAQINQILAELWRQTYRGSDIDTIELRSEDDATSTKTRRSYTYRVVMKRGNSEMDMRGRCSAGQKVLASVLIRLALSEAFCCDCGILALDEPTTNLDEDNARSLAESLRLLIDNHRAVKHFQLIVITHDEQFVRALGGQALDTFYYVHKDREGAFSVIDERTFDQLFAA